MEKQTVYIEDDTPNHIIKSAYIVCTTPRSGSNLLTFTLEQQGLGRPNEYFNPNRKDINRYLQQHLQKDIPHTQDYLHKFAHLTPLQKIIQHNRCCERGIFGSKLFAQDLNCEEQLFQSFQENMLVPTKYILLKRKDIISQAISLHFATETKQWHSSTKTSSQVEQVSYDYNTLERYLTHFKIAQAFWATQFPTATENVLILDYADLAENYTTTIQRVNTFLGHEGIEVPVPPIQKQSDPLKEVFRKRFIADFRAQHKK
jgi:trehalose 2-sulfotransferase